MAVEDFAHGVEMPGVRCRLDDHVQHHCSYVGKVNTPLVPHWVALAWALIGLSCVDDRVGTADFVSILGQDRFRGVVGVELPVGVWSFGEEVEWFAADDAAEQVVLVGEGEVFHQAEAMPARWQH